MKLAVVACAALGVASVATFVGLRSRSDRGSETRPIVAKASTPVTAQALTPSQRVVVPDDEVAVRSRAIRRNSALEASVAVDTLRLAAMYGDSTIFARITAIREVGPRLVVADSRTSPHLFVFDRGSSRLIRSHGRQGSGPGEIIYPSTILPDEHKRGLVWVYDFNQRRLSGFDVLRGQDDADSPTIKLPHAGTLLQPVLASGRIVSNGLFPSYSLVFMDTTGRPTGRADLTAPFGPPSVTSNTARRLVNVSTMTYSPSDRSRLALAYQFAAELDIIDLKSGRHVTANGPRPVRASFRIDPKTKRFFWNKDNQHAYWDLTATEHFIFALFSGEKDDSRASGEVFAQRIHVFDWEGRFLLELATDRPITTLSINETGDVLYGSIEEPWPAAAAFPIPRSVLALLNRQKGAQ